LSNNIYVNLNFSQSELRVEYYCRTLNAKIEDRLKTS